MSDLIEQLIRRIGSRKNILEADNWFGGNSDPTTEAFPPATPEQISRSEDRLGFRLPGVYRDVLMQVANGGFGTGYGILGVEGGFAEAVGFTGRTYTAVDQYEAWRRRPEQPRWPEKILPLCTWGCEIYSCLDCSIDDGLVIAFDPNLKGDGPWRSAYGAHCQSFSQWLTGWIVGEEWMRTWPLAGDPKLWFEEHPEQQ